MNRPKGQRWLFNAYEEHFIAESLGDGTCVVIQIFPGETKKVGYTISTPSWDDAREDHPWNHWTYLKGQDAPN